MTIRPARVPDEVPAVRELFRAYAASLGVDLCFQSFDAELAGLPGAYSPPAGRLLVVEGDGDLAGCVALRPHAGGVGEMKRLYVRPTYRGRGLGRALINRVVAEATAAGYPALVLDTLPAMGEAIALYRSAGFAQTAPYTFNPVPGALYFRKELAPAAHE
jgi:ribosomal protein S18 acetylase RimI-like enzyme